MNPFSPVDHAILDMLQQQGFQSQRWTLPCAAGQVAVQFVDDGERFGFQIKTEEPSGHELLRQETISRNAFPAPLDFLDRFAALLANTLRRAHGMADQLDMLNASVH
jgi:hypothetical protein